MTSEEDLAESGTSSLAASTSQVSRTARPGASENLSCPICRAGINDQPFMSWRWHPFCFYCMVEWFHRRVEGLICQSPFPYTFHMVGDSNSEVDSVEESISSASHTQREQAGSCSAERGQHNSPGRQHRKSYSRSCGGSRGGSHGGSRGGSCGGSRQGSRGGSLGGSRRGSRGSSRQGSRGGSRQGSHGGSRGGSRRGSRRGSRGSSRQGSRRGSLGGSRRGSRGGSHGGSRGRAQEKSRSRYPRRHHDGHARVQQAQGYNHSRSRRRQQSRARSTVRDKGRRTKQRVRALSGRRKRRQQEYQVSFIEPRAIRSRSRQRLRRSSSQTLREYLREMERDEGRALRHDWFIRASSGRSRRQQPGHQHSYRETQVARSRTQGRFRSPLPLKENPRRMECSERQIEQGIHASPRRSERLQQARQVSLIEPQVTRSQSRRRSRSTQHQTVRENLRRMEHDILTSMRWNERHQQRRQADFTDSQVAKK